LDAQVVVSCYAFIDDHSVAHWAFAPVRLYHNVVRSLVHLWKTLSVATPPSAAAAKMADADADQVGIHWYASVLYRIAKYVLPSHLVYN